MKIEPALRTLAGLVALAIASPASAAPPSPTTHAEPIAPEPASPQGRPMAIAGTVLIVASAAGYVAMAVGLGVGNDADANVRSLQAADELERRRDEIERGQLGNRVAIGAGVASVALMAAGVSLIVVGRRRMQRSSIAIVPGPRGAGLQLSTRF